MFRMQLVVLVHGARRDGCTVRPAPGRANSRVRPAAAAAARVQLRACPVPPPVGSHAWRGSPACSALRLRCPAHHGHDDSWILRMQTHVRPAAWFVVRSHHDLRACSSPFHNWSTDAKVGAILWWVCCWR
jgi:hypothetical protein